MVAKQHSSSRAKGGDRGSGRAAHAAPVEPHHSLLDKMRTIGQVAISSDAKWRFHLDAVCDFALPTDYIGPIVLIANEAVRNAIEYAHPTGIGGMIGIRIGTFEDDGRIRIEISDDGVGLPEGFDPTQDGGHGIRLMRRMSEQIGAQLAFHSTCLGLNVQLRLPRLSHAVAPEVKGAGVGPELDASDADQLIQDLIDGRSPRAILGDDGRWRHLFQALPAAIYTTDAVGRITFFNEAAADLWGCRPELGQSEFCGSWKLFWADGTPMSHDECPMAMALKEKKPIRGMEAIAQRPDGTRVSFIPYPTPIFGSSGILIGAINMLVDISDRKRTEETVVRHRDEQAALYRFTDRLFRAGSLSEVCNAAMAAISEALGCRRSSILLFDDADIMRFVAWSGLSDGYRNAVEGHSPWTRGAKDAQPICISDVEDADLAASLKDVVQAEGIRALAFIPLAADNELIGKFMIYYGEARRFTDSEINLALTIARQLGFGIERIRSQEARARAEAESRLLVSIVETSGDAIVSKTLDGTITSWNGGAKRVYGYDAEDIIGKPVMLIIPPERISEEREIIDRIRSGARVEPFDTVRRHKNGSLIDVSMTVSPVVDARGNIVGASVISRDIGERKRYQAQQDLLLHELTHRVKNTLATVQAMAGQTLRTASKEELQSFSSRLHALAAAYDLLTRDNWDRAPIGELIRRAVDPFKAARFSLHGPDVFVSASQALKLTMALHELATNAVKYGALSNTSGTVDITWQCADDGRLEIAWREAGGPKVAPPEKKGFGSRLLEHSTEEIRVNFAPEGLACSFRLMAA